jgi:hypothetical protein
MGYHDPGLHLPSPICLALDDVSWGQHTQTAAV